MALLSPSLLPPAARRGGLYRELDVLDLLQATLSDGYEIFHSVSLQNDHDGLDRQREIDVVVLGPAGNLLLIEVKAGAVTLRDGSIYKLYGNGEKDVARQCRMQFNAMLGRLKEAGLNPYVASCLVLPDYQVPDAHIVAMQRSHIVDATQYAQLGSHVREILSAASATNEVDALRRFLRNEFHVVPDLSVMSEQLQHTVRQISGGLASWVPRITSPSRCIRVQATAGSGKTQLAHRLLDHAVTSGQAALYVCFNRSLADHMVSISSARAQVLTFHEACVAHHRRKHGEPDFTQAGIFAEITAAYIADSADFNAKYDVLIVDEGQDFEPEWLQSLLYQLKDDGRLYLLEDDNQRLYDRSPFDLPEAVVVDCAENYRSPRAICDVINAFGLATPTVRSCNPYQGQIPGFHVYATPEQLVAQTVHAVGLLLAQGFSVENIVVLTGHGLSRSALLGREMIGPYSTRRFTGAYDRAGNPVWTAGELLVESVYRYKGQSAPAIVLAEMDFVELGAAERRKLFVGMTRAQVALEMVVSREAEVCFAEVLGA
jgi:hypothetical protein